MGRLMVGRVSAFVSQVHDEPAQALYVCIQVVSTFLFCMARFSDHTDEKLPAVLLLDEGATASISCQNMVQKL